MQPPTPLAQDSAVMLRLAVQLQLLSLRRESATGTLHHSPLEANETLKLTCPHHRQQLLLLAAASGRWPQQWESPPQALARLRSHSRSLQASALLEGSQKHLRQQHLRPGPADPSLTAGTRGPIRKSDSRTQGIALYKDILTSSAGDPVSDRTRRSARRLGGKSS